MMKNFEQIIIVDDTPIIADMVANILEEAGFTNFKTYEDPFQALKEVKNVNNVKLVITDFRMPGMNGVELLKAINEYDDNINGIIMSAEGEYVRRLESGYNVVDKGIHFSKKIIDYVKGSVELDVII